MWGQRWVWISFLQCLRVVAELLYKTERQVLPLLSTSQSVSLSCIVDLLTMLTERPHTIHLPKFGKVVDPVKRSAPNPRAVAQEWISKLETVLASKDVSRLGSIMHEDCWWRDMLAFEWDLRTIHGLDQVKNYVGKNLEDAQLSKFKLHQTGQFAPSIAKPIEGLEWVESMFDFQSKTGRGSGMLRIVQGADGVWKGYMIYTVLKELKGFEEKAGFRRGHGGNNSLLGGAIKGNWLDRRQRKADFLDDEPQVVIIGAGQAGLNTAARLQALGMSCLIVDKNSRIGDNWRHRYRVSHCSAHIHCGSMPNNP